MRSGDIIDEEQMPVTRQQEPPTPPPKVEPVELAIITDETLVDEPVIFEDVEINPSDLFNPEDLLIGDLIEEEMSEEAFFLVEEMPLFMGGNHNTFGAWIQRNMTYPSSAVQGRISGKVHVYFAVNSAGQVEDVQILSGLTPEIDREIVRVILSSSGLWTPGKQRGRPVKVLFNFPISFVL